METILKIVKTSEPHIFELEITDRLNLKDPKKKHDFS